MHLARHSFYPSFCVGYEVTKDEYFKSVALTAADSLLSRFNDKIGAITVLGETEKSGLTAIDTMMNLPLLWWAYEKTADRKYYDASYKHAFTTMQYFVRDDGSTYHIVEFNPNNGRVVRRTTLQGYNEESCWSRGQAWGVGGFAIAYKYTKREEFLRTAEKLTDYYFVNCSSNYVPYWDFDDVSVPNMVKDSSAAAITASGLSDLLEIKLSKAKSEKYKETFMTRGDTHDHENNKVFSYQRAYKILETLSKNYLADNSSQGILRHGCFNKPNNIAIDSSLVWGDYYYMEALIKSLEYQRV